MASDDNTASGSLVDAIRRADPAGVARILSDQPALANTTVPAHPAERDPEGTTPLHWAMPGDGRKLKREHVEVARLLLENGANPDAIGNGPNHGRCAALSLAAWGNHVPLIELLLEHGADPDGSGPGRTPIRTAAEHNHVDAVNALIEAGASHSLYELLLAGLEARVASYLDGNPRAVTEPVEGSPPLHVALSTSTGAKLVPLLLDREARPEQRDEHGRTALHAAIDLGHEEAIQVLRVDGFLDLFAAAGLGEADRVTELLASDGSSVHESHTDGTTALFYAILSGSTLITEALLDAGADPSPRSTRHWACLTPLHLAIMRRNMPLVRLLLAHRADVDAYADEGAYNPTPLHVAARWGGLEHVSLLLDHGADPLAGGPATDAAGAGVLSWVAYAGQTEILERLVDGGLDLTDPACGGVLHVAAARGHTAFVERLLCYGVDVSAEDGEGRTPLERAVEQGRVETAAVLQAHE